jgi:membrane associated rhomboid family serine protease
MSNSAAPTFEGLLRLVEAAAPGPWYPKAYAAGESLPREQLDPLLNDLRMAGLLSMTDWSKETGQGYVLTSLGREVLNNPQVLSRLRDGTKVTLRVQEETPEAERPRTGQPTTFERGETVRNALLYPDPPKFTWILIYLNVAIFLVGIVWSKLSDRIGFFEGRDALTLHDMGALMAFDLVRDQWWRVLACCFLHFGIFHIGMNMYALYATGQRLESLWGRWRYLALYLLSGLGGATIAVIYSPNSLLAGASGAIWGLMMSPLVWVYFNRQFLPKSTVRDWLSQWWMIVLCNVVISFLPGISAAAHFGGGAVGLLVSVLLHYERFGSQIVRQLATATMLLIPVVCFGAIHSARENDPRWIRLGQVGQANQIRGELKEFRQQAKPLFDLFGKQFDQLDQEMSGLIQRPKEKRTDDELNTAKAKPNEMNQQMVPLIPLLAGDANDAAALGELKQIGAEYLRATQQLLDEFAPLLDRPPPEGKEAAQLREARNALKKARIAWEARAK